MSRLKFLIGSSKATATRDLRILEELGVLIVHGGGRSTQYYLNLGDEPLNTFYK